ncbi:hypothetical protein [Chryseolinea lacunae]|uniref:hypothetical protein n=1 Tax=Chryseolinea lacunae TaxID=2801331 RepID=UPI001F26EBB1|nr:hypothetical protein [Chryseolinea lacunae]
MTLILLSVAGIFLMGVCAAVIGSNIETGAYFNMALYVIVSGSIVLSYLSNRYLFVYTKLKKL